MTALTPLYPRRKVPALEVRTVGGGLWRLAEQKPKTFTLLAFYRGLHCPICSRYLADLDSRLPEFDKRGVGVIAVSSDDANRAGQSKQTWKIPNLAVGYGLDLDTARRWGLYISRGRGKTSAGVDEPALFSEPGLFLVRPDGTLYFATVQTMPFARPNFAEILAALDFVLVKDYPARGEVVDHAAAAD